MRNAWTGGQYSAVRALFGTYLFVHFVFLLPYSAEVFSSQGVLPDASASPFANVPNVLAVIDTPAFVVTLVSVAGLASAAFAAGWHDRIAALVIAYVWACLFGRNPLISNPSLPYVGWMLVAHACLPPAPYGSWAARGRADAGGRWQFPRGIFAAAWIAMAVGYSYSGAMKLTSPSWTDGTALERVLHNPLARPGVARDALLAMPSGLLNTMTWGALAFEVLFAPLALIPRVRPWIWIAMLGMHVSLIALIDFADLSLGMVCLHLLTFDPAWLPPRREPGDRAVDGAPARIYYDERCGLCHGFVRFALAEDASGTAFRFAALQSETFAARVPADIRANLPDTLVVERADGALLVRSDAALHVAARLGGIWRALAVAARVVPRGLRDRAYDAVARMRRRIFGTPDDVCPVVAPEIRARFDS